MDYGHNDVMGGGYKSRLPMVKSWDTVIKTASRPTGNLISGADTFDALSKALATGTISGYGDATPLRLENLDQTMTEVLLTAEHLRLFRSLPRVASIQEIFQWIRHTGYGSHRGSPGFMQGGAPTGGVSSWQRGNGTVRWMGVKRGYTHQLQVTGQMGGTFVDPVSSENSDGTRQLLEMIERWLLWGQSNIHDINDNVVNYDGLYAQIKAGRPKSIIDMRNKPIDFETLEMIGFRLNTDGKLLNFNNLTTTWHPKVLSDLGMLKLQAERINLGQQEVAGYRPGVPLDGYRSQFGFIPLDSSLLLDQVENGLCLTTAQPNSPSRPATVTGTNTSDATSKMDAGTYYYFVSSTNDAGESDTRTITSPVAVASGEKAVLTIDRTTGATGYRVYRGTTNDPTKAGWIGWIPQPMPSGNATFNDLNEILPLSWMGVILNLSQEDIALAQMAPLIKFPLAVVDTTIPFLLMLYHTLILKAMERMILVINIGDRIPRDQWLS